MTMSGSIKDREYQKFAEVNGETTIKVYSMNSPVDLSGYEILANKSNDGTLSEDSSALYPTQHAVKEYADAISANEQTIRDVGQFLTGFRYPENVILTYSSTNRTITITGNCEAYFNGIRVSSIVSGFVSDPHPDVLDHTYFLYYNGASFVWEDNAFPGFYNLLIAVAYYRTGTKFCVRECHGFQEWQSHKNDHYNIGCYRTAGGDISNIVLNSSTADNRRPIISACTINDEDLPTINPALTSKAYSQRYMSGASTINYNLDSSDIVPLSTNNPYYNQWNGSAFVQTLMPANSVMTVWLYQVPCTSDTDSQKIRHAFVQGQSITQAQNSSPANLLIALNTEKLKTPIDLNLGTPLVLSSEFVCIHKFIIQYTGGAWTIVYNADVTGNKISQGSIPSGNYLSTITTSTEFSGDGTAGSPLTLSTTTPIALSVALSASNLSNTNTGDETEATILSKMSSYPVIFDPSKTMFDYDDFNNPLSYYNTSTGWLGSSTNSGSVSVGAGATGRIVLNTGTSSNGGVGIRKNNDVYLGYGVIVFESVVKVVTIDSLNDLLYFSVGIHNGASSSYNVADGCYFNTHSTRPNWTASTSIYSGGRIGTDTDSGVAISTNNVKLKIIITNLTEAKFYIDGNLVATNSTNFPTNSTALGVSFCARQGGSSTSNRQVEIDYYWKRYDLTTPR